MATIKIQRTQEYSNKLRSYKVFIDGQKACTIGNGETKYFTTAAGAHTVSVKIDWCGSPELTLQIADNEVKQLTVGSFKNAKWMMPVAGGVLALHFICKLAFDFQYFVFLILPFFLMMTYYLSFGRNKYLSLGEIS